MEYPFVYVPPICAVYHLTCTAQPGGIHEWGQVLTFAHGGVVEYCASQSGTPVLKMTKYRLAVSLRKSRPNKMTMSRK